MPVSSEQLHQLLAFVEGQVERNGCDHTHRFTREWAGIKQVNWDDLLDVLEANGGFCDCEVLNNGKSDARAPFSSEREGDRHNWRLPPDWTSPSDAVFTKTIICKAALGRNTHASDGELLVPAPFGVKSRKRTRASVHFFVGLDSGLPAEVGVVAACEPTTAAAFADRVRISNWDELRQFSEHEAAFVLSRVASLSPGTPVGTHFLETSGTIGKRQELRVHKVFLGPRTT